MTADVRDSLDIRVHGIPAPQGSKRHVGRGILVESSRKVAPWRQAVKWEALAAGLPTVEGPVKVALVFVLPRPLGHYGTGRNAGILRPNAPRLPDRRPDLDKLVRSTLDALGEANVWRDDCQVVEVVARKVYESRAVGGPGAAIVVDREIA